MDMNINLNTNIAANYRSNTQKIRVITEYWVKQNGYCPNCGNKLLSFANNRPVSDFFCDNCKEEFELKSKKGAEIGMKIVDGAYSSMLNRITSERNPHFFFLTYDKTKMTVVNFFIIPNFYFTPEIIEKRNPLTPTAKRSGWIGCNINLSLIPEMGKVFYVKNSITFSKYEVLHDWEKTQFLKTEERESRGWIIDILNCIDKIDKEIFSLQDIYKFESHLKLKHPNNNFIKDKIRQQLQLLRDKGIIEFLGKGKYRKVH
ncbi:Type II site-specific deoxyribonuclease [Calditerrivibrio nitroreducens DSM 19672]|uniref:Type II site-specific deoxyribonuclease n=2 Tax=Calditerrivibrio nitroreducens TaxID=477976 RepID=E4TET5_CALNY|nr:Type II site-specific deoxyribonuclease [Calditerrivibrio nitroreducens DSM 19672]